MGATATRSGGRDPGAGGSGRPAASRAERTLERAAHLANAGRQSGAAPARRHGAGLCAAHALAR